MRCFEGGLFLNLRHKKNRIRDAVLSLCVVAVWSYRVVLSGAIIALGFYQGDPQRDMPKD